jgi:hypothetical protein
VPAAPLGSAETCKREAEELARMRANPDRDSAQRFARSLRCEALKAQPARLLESVAH